MRPRYEFYGCLFLLTFLYDWTMSLARHPNALIALAVISFLESSIFPMPPDVLMTAMIVAQPNRAFVIALAATISSVAGGLAGYRIGQEAFATLGRPILEFYGKES